MGDANSVYYNHGNSSDYAVITDFINGIDRIQLHGSVADYKQSSQGNDVLLYYGVNQDLVAKFQNIASLDLNNSANFV
ncbi:MAG: hypothetical protein AAFQ57_13770 [Cyanobacteria bacterium J06626_14]